MSDTESALLWQLAWRTPTVAVASTRRILPGQSLPFVRRIAARRRAGTVGIQTGKTDQMDCLTAMR